MDIIIELPLPVGSGLTINGYRMEVRSVEPYTRRDGQASALVEWVSHCTDCGAEFAQVLGATMLPKSTKRCEECRGGAWGHKKA